MKNITRISSAMALLAIPLTCPATVFFNDTFVNGSTFTNTVNATPTTNSTSYQISSSKAMTSTNALPGFLKFGINATSSGGIEVQALFTANPVAMVQANNDFIRLTV